MKDQRYVVIGAGEVGTHLARLLSQAGHNVVVVDQDPARREEIAEELDVSTVLGNAALVPVLEAAGAQDAVLVMAVTSSDEANLVASSIAKRLGAERTVVRVQVADDVIRHRKIYEEEFKADLLLSTQLLTTLRILDSIRGHNTVAVEYLAGGKVQLRKIHIEPGSILTRRPLREIEMPRNSLIVAFLRGEGLVIPGGGDQAKAGDDALVLATTEVIGKVERMLSVRRPEIGRVVIAGGGETGFTVARFLQPLKVPVTFIERRRDRADELASSFPGYHVLHGDATDPGFLRAERIGDAGSFVAVSGQDERNLMASLVAQELGVRRVVTLVNRAERLRLWRRLGLEHVVAPRSLAYEKIRDYIASDYNPRLVSLQQGGVVLERTLHPASPAAGVTLAEMAGPRGLIVGAVVRDDRVFVPRGSDRLEAGDTVVLFVVQEEIETVQLLFPGREA